jgi:hypothetical protein
MAIKMPEGASLRASREPYSGKRVFLALKKCFGNLLDYFVLQRSKACKQRRGTYFYYNRAAIGLACAQATAMRIDIAPHKRPRRKQTRHVPDPHYFHLPPYAHLHY